MDKKTLEERVAHLERVAHYHNTVERINATEEADKMQMTMEEADKAASKGSAHGDPVFIIE
ncbi:MAG: hypothetical protein PHP63_08880 [Candidatus Marinimicrobia bacterium]|jgi:uncharacterized coiled-coil protein SlyX|nr:hypothetical protein [Candidatus Neomarinimicrobiota bacterium]